MNIHEHQAKEILKEFGAPVSNGVVIFSVNEIKKKISQLRSNEFVLKAQIHAGGRGKAGGVKLIKKVSDLEEEARKMMGKILVTHQTGPEGKEVKRLYIEGPKAAQNDWFLLSTYLGTTNAANIVSFSGTTRASGDALAIDVFTYDYDDYKLDCTSSDTGTTCVEVLYYTE